MRLNTKHKCMTGNVHPEFRLANVCSLLKWKHICQSQKLEICNENKKCGQTQSKTA